MSQNYSMSKGMSSANTQSNAYIAQSDLMKDNRPNMRQEMKRNESKSSTNFTNTKDEIRKQQNRLMRLNNENYVLDSPDIGQRKVNNKAGV